VISSKQLATGDVTATDRNMLLRVVCGPSVAKKGLRASAGALADLPLFCNEQWHCSPCGVPAKSGRQKPSTGLVWTLTRRFFDDDTSEARSASTLSAAGDRQPIGFLSQDLRGSIGQACRERSRSPQTGPSPSRRAGKPFTGSGGHFFHSERASGGAPRAEG
jgi:hypothetical protein